MTRGLTGKKLLKYVVSIAMVGIVLGYALWISRDLLFGIRFTIAGISDGMTTTQSVIEFSGIAHHATILSVDGQIVPLAEDGSWKDMLALLPGYNTIQIQITDAFHRVSTRQYRVFYSGN